jgi:hypothetical protein
MICSKAWHGIWWEWKLLLMSMTWMLYMGIPYKMFDLSSKFPRVFYVMRNFVGLLRAHSKKVEMSKSLYPSLVSLIFASDKPNDEKQSLLFEIHQVINRGNLIAFNY